MSHSAVRKVISKTYLGPDHHQKFIDSFPLLGPIRRRVSVESADYLCTDPAERHTNARNIVVGGNTDMTDEHAVFLSQ